MRALALSLTILASTMLVSTVSADDGDLHGQIVQAFEAINEAFNRRDTVAIEALTTENHIAIAPYLGGFATLHELLAADQFLEVREHPVGEITVTSLAPDVALQTHVVERTGTFRGEPIAPRVAVSIIWVQRDGRWLERQYQETAIADAQ